MFFISLFNPLFRKSTKVSGGTQVGSLCEAEEGTPGVLTQEILAAATGVAKTSIRDQEQYFRRHLKGKRFIEFWEGLGGLLDDVRGS